MLVLNFACWLSQSHTASQWVSLVHWVCSEKVKGCMGDISDISSPLHHYCVQTDRSYIIHPLCRKQNTENLQQNTKYFLYICVEGVESLISRTHSTTFTLGTSSGQGYSLTELRGGTNFTFIRKSSLFLAYNGKP